MKTRLTKRELLTSIMFFAVGALILVALIFLTLFATLQGDFVPFLSRNANIVLTVGISFFVIFTIMYFYLYFEDKAMLAQKGKIVELFFLLGLSFVLCELVDKMLNSMARPLIFYALMAGNVFKRREAVFTNTVFAFFVVFNRYLVVLDDSVISAYAGGIQIEIIVTLLGIYSGGIISVFLIKEVKTRLGCVMITFVLFIPVFIMNFLQFPYVEDLGAWIPNVMLYSALNCLMSMLLFEFGLPVFERVFSELTTFRLRELTSDGAVLIKKLKESAYGTYNHSIVVAQIAEACANAIGEDGELARAAAYYHDIGKLRNPEMFAENQSDYNVHGELTPELSADIIRSHTRDGAKLISRYRLPKIFADVAIQHHGTMPIKYFYAKALKMSDGSINMNNYSYMGPAPTSKLAAIIMIADSSEAAVRSLPVHTPENVETVVRGLVEERMNMDQFVDCDITLRELSVIIRTIVNSLTGVYHSRVSYPKLILRK